MYIKNNNWLMIISICCFFSGCGEADDDDQTIDTDTNFRTPVFDIDDNNGSQNHGNDGTTREMQWSTSDFSPTEIINTLFPNNMPTNLNDINIPMPNRNQNGEIFSLYKNDEIKTSFNDIAGLEEPKKALKTILDYLQDPGAFKRLGAVPPAGVLFYGPPGTGKTEIARALAGEVGKMRKVSFIVASGASFENKYVGVGADNVRKLFAMARANKPAIIFIDEFDALAGKRSEEKKNAQVVNQLLTELDGFNKEERDEIFIIAATNLRDDIDAAVLRPGRIDRSIKIGLPNDTARKAIIEHYMTVKPPITGIDTANWANKTRNWSAAELKALVNEARIHATAKNADKVNDNDFQEAWKLLKNGRRN